MGVKKPPMWKWQVVVKYFDPIGTTSCNDQKLLNTFLKYLTVCWIPCNLKIYKIDSICKKYYLLYYCLPLGVPVVPEDQNIIATSSSSIGSSSTGGISKLFPLFKKSNQNWDTSTIIYINSSEKHAGIYLQKTENYFLLSYHLDNFWGKLVLI